MTPRTPPPPADSGAELKPCLHLDFNAHVVINRLEDSGRFQADIKIHCTACMNQFRFIGLPGGLDLNGASVNAFGDVASLAIAPPGEVIPPINSAIGFSIRGGSLDEIQTKRIQSLESEVSRLTRELEAVRGKLHDAADSAFHLGLDVGTGRADMLMGAEELQQIKSHYSTPSDKGEG